MCEGDCIIFTRSNEKTRDIVENMLKRMINENRVPERIVNNYNMSKQWKNVLIEYMNKSGETPREIAKKMIENGVSVQEMTIKGWLDEDSHTVGPRDIDSIRQIALVAGDDDLFENAERCYEACSMVRKVRRKILNVIGNAILGELSGSDEQNDPMYAPVYEHISELAKILQIETITRVEQTVPVNLINRPINLDD